VQPHLYFVLHDKQNSDTTTILFRDLFLKKKPIKSKGLQLGDKQTSCQSSTWHLSYSWS